VQKQLNNFKEADVEGKNFPQSVCVLLGLSEGIEQFAVESFTLLFFFSKKD
jgi:hypothetical protein